jgi:hypothetical protein
MEILYFSGAQLFQILRTTVVSMYSKNKVWKAINKLYGPFYVHFHLITSSTSTWKCLKRDLKAHQLVNGYNRQLSQVWLTDVLLYRAPLTMLWISALPSVTNHTHWTQGFSHASNNPFILELCPPFLRKSWKGHVNHLKYPWSINLKPSKAFPHMRLAYNVIWCTTGSIEEGIVVDIWVKFATFDYNYQCNMSMVLLYPSCNWKHD